MDRSVSDLGDQGQGVVVEALTLKLTGMAQALEEQMAQPATPTLGFEERLRLLLDR